MHGIGRTTPLQVLKTSGQSHQLNRVGYRHGVPDQIPQWYWLCDHCETLAREKDSQCGPCVLSDAQDEPTEEGPDAEGTNDAKVAPHDAEDAKPSACSCCCVM